MPDQKQLLRRQQILADFGEFAIRSEDLDEVLTEACRLVADALGTGRAKVLEIDEDRQELLVRAGVGWARDVVGKVRLQMRDRSSETYAIKAAEPVISQDISVERRFDIPDFMKEAGVVALVNVPIVVPGQRPYGVLQVDDTRPRAFGEGEIQFLRTYAMILGPVIDRLHLVQERAVARERLRSSEVRHRLLVESWAQAVWEVDAQGVVVADSPSWRAYTGQTLEEWLGDGWLDAIHPDDQTHAERQWREAIATTRLVDAEFRLRAPGGGWRWTNVRAAPVFDAEGKVEKWAGMNIDIDARKQAEAALRESEDRFRKLFESIDEGYLLGEVLFDEAGSVADIRFLQANPAALQIAGRDFTGRRMRDIDPRYEDYWFEAYGRVARTGEPLRAEQYSEPHGRWFDFRLSKVGPMHSRLVACVFQDITERKQSEERQQVLVAELQHRTRNILAVVRSMADKTARASADLADFREHFRDRLDALARVQGLLSRLKEHDRVTCDELIDTELSAMSVRTDRIRWDGPKGVRLRSSMVQTLAMALHELATNAVKYGALAQESGQLEVTWRVTDDDDAGGRWLHINWRERGVDMPPRGDLPVRSGQGRELIEKALPYQLGAKTSYELGPDGVHCTISVPVSTAAAKGETGV